MPNIWTEIVDLYDRFALLLLAPFLICMGVIALIAGIFGTEKWMLSAFKDLFIGGLQVALPLSAMGIILFLFLRFAREKS